MTFKDRKCTLLLSFILVIAMTNAVAAGGNYKVVPLHINDRSCSSFCLDNNGYAVFGSNYDNDIPEGLVFINKRGISKTGIVPNTAGTVAEWTSKYASVTFSVVGYEFAWSGMNEKGLVMSTMALGETQNPATDARPPLHSPQWMQYMLDNCSTVDEVIAADSLVRIFQTVDHYLVADRKGNCATIEFLDGRMVYHIGKSLPFKALTNSTYAESADFVEKSVAGSKETDSAQSTNGSLRRFRIAAERTKSFTPGTAEQAVEYAFETLDEVGSDATLWSMVFDTQNLSVYFRTHSHRAIRFLKLSDFDLSCESPDMMLDINDKLNDNVAGSMQVYSSDANFQFLKAALIRWEIQLSDEQVQMIRDVIDGYDCK